MAGTEQAGPARVRSIPDEEITRFADGATQTASLGYLIASIIGDRATQTDSLRYLMVSKSSKAFASLPDRF